MTQPPSPECVVKVGDGRGFIIEQRISTAALGRRKGLNGERLRPFVELRLVVTAAHCLPELPSAHALSLREDRTHWDLLSSLDGARKKVCAECLFADPVADIAVLGCPDNQELSEEAEGYDALTSDAPALTIGKLRGGKEKGWLLALDRPRWIPTTLQLYSGLERSSLVTGPTKAGMSGSPILNDRGEAVGVVVIGSETVDAASGRRVDKETEPQPILTRNLPGWVLSGR